MNMIQNPSRGVFRTGVAPSIILLLVGCCLTACSAPPPNPADNNGAEEDTPPAEEPPTEILGVVDGEPITMEDVRARVGERLDQMETSYLQSRYELIDETLQSLLRERVLDAEAEERGVTASALRAAEIPADPEISDVEVSVWFDENKSRLGDRSLDQVRDQIEDYLRILRTEEAETALLTRLSEEHGARFLLEPFRVALEVEGAPSLGPSDAPITLVEFSDFQCPYCQRLHETLLQVRDQYPSEVRLVFQQFPLPNLHANAFKAAEASLCARDQERFWEMHDLMFEDQANLAVSQLKEKAQRLGLDPETFAECLDSGRYVEQVQTEQSRGRSVGVTGTPALFLNGIPVKGGAVGFAALSEQIEEELERSED